MEQTRTCGRRRVSPSHTNGGSVHPQGNSYGRQNPEMERETEKIYRDRHRDGDETEQPFTPCLTKFRLKGGFG